MGKCKWCENKGFFLHINKNGLCNKCDTEISIDVQSRLKVINESANIINKSNKFNTIIGRIFVILENAEALMKYEEKGLKIIEPLPSTIIEMAEKEKYELIQNEIIRLFNEGKTKSELATTQAGKINPLNRIIIKLNEFRDKYNLDDNFISTYEKNIRTLINKTQYEIYVNNAKKYEFKGSINKAIDQYKEALYFLKTDDIDDSSQYDLINELENRIAELETTK